MSSPLRFEKMLLVQFLAFCAVFGLVPGCVSTGDISDEWHEGEAATSVQGEAFSHYIASLVYERQGDPERAVQEMRTAADLDPSAITPTLRLIRSYLRLSQTEDALAMAKRAVEQAPDHPNLRIVLGEIHHQMKHFDEATEAFQKAIELRPDNILGYGALAELQESTNDLVSAIGLYEKLIELSPKSAGLHYQLGLNLARIGDLAGAQEALVNVLRLNPRMIRAQYLLGTFYLESGESRRSAYHLNEYLKKRSDDPRALEHLAGALAQLGHYDQARKAFAQLIGSRSATPQHHIQAMYLEILSGHPENAPKLAPPAGAPLFSTLLTAMARQAAGEPYLPMVESLDGVEGDLDEECNTFLKDLLYLFGDEKTGAKILEATGQFLEEVDSRAVTIIHARTLMDLERFAEAVAVLDPLRALHPDDKWIHYYLAMSHEELDHFEETERHLKAYLDIDPDDPELLNFLGYLYAEHGTKLDEAEKLLLKALESDPESPFFLDSLGWVYYGMGRIDEAIDLIQRAIYNMESDDAILRDHLGDAWIKKGDVERAVGEWERAIRLDPELEGVQEKLDRYRERLPAKEPR